MTTVSIIIPCYNVCNFIEKTASSILSQTYENLELILVNDGSTDGTYEQLLYLEASDSRVKVQTQKNKGVVAARKNGFLASSGEIILFVDGDDGLVDTALTEVVAVFDANEVDLVRFGYEKVDLDRNLLRIARPLATGLQSLESLLDGGVEGLKALFSSSIGDKAYERQLVSKVFSEIGEIKINHSEDMLFAIIAFLNSKQQYFLDRALYQYVTRPGSVVESFNPRSVECKECYLRTLEQTLVSDCRLPQNFDVPAFMRLEANEAVNYILYNTMRYAPGWSVIHEKLRELKCSFFFMNYICGQKPQNLRQFMRNLAIRAPLFLTICFVLAGRLKILSIERAKTSNSLKQS